MTARPTDRSFHTGPSAALPRRPRFRSLASRLVALGVVQLVLLAATAAVIFIAEGPHEEANPEDKLTPAMVARLEKLIDSPAALSDALDELRRARVELSLYDDQHQLIATNIDPPLAIPPRPPRRMRRPGDPPPRPDWRPPLFEFFFGGAPDDRPPPPHGELRSPGPPPDDDHPTGDRAPGGTSSGDRPSSGASSSSGERPSGGPSSRDRTPGEPSSDDRSSGDRPPGDRRSGAPSPGETRSTGRPMPDLAALRQRFMARHHLIWPFRVHGARGVLVARGVHGEPPGLTGPVLALCCGFLILVIGALLTARWIVRPIERLSRTARALGSGDLKARSQLDRPDEIGELGHRFDEMAERIAKLLATEKELLANVAHELRTPLTRIGVALDLASEGDAEAARASLAEIAVDVSELETIVDDILTAMRFEIAAGKAPAQLPLRRTTLPAGEIATAAAERLRARHPERPLEVAVDDDAPDIHVDPMLFRRVIDNLLENAHKYTPDTAAPIELSVRRDGGDAVFEVRDRGIGIPADDLPRIFTAFFRGERSRSRETGGVGLGLTLARRIVEAHGGAIDATSAPSAGTQMRVTIPAS